MELRLDEQTVKEIVLEVSPKIEELTELDVDLKGIDVKLIRRDELWENSLKSIYEKINLGAFLKTEPIELERMHINAIESYLVFAEYTSVTDKIFLLPENLGEETNRDGLCAVLGHEIVHRCQKINNPKFDKIFYELLRRSRLTRLLYDQEDTEADMLIEAMMYLIEGDAYHVQTRLTDKFYPFGCFKYSAKSLIKHAKYKDEPKKRQYDEGSLFVERIFSDGGRERVNGLYNLTPENLYIIIRSILNSTA